MSEAGVWVVSIVVFFALAALGWRIYEHRRNQSYQDYLKRKRRSGDSMWFMPDSFIGGGSSNVDGDG